MTHKLNELALAEINVTSATVQYANKAAGSLELEIALTSPLETPVPWNYNDRLELTWNGKHIFSGVIREMSYALSATSNSLRVTAYDDWKLLEETIFARYVTSRKTGRHAAPGGFVGVESIKNKTISLSRACREITDWCTHKSVGVSVGVSGMIIPYSTNGSESCASMLQAALKWVPSSVATVRQPGNSLVIADMSSQPVINIPIDSIDAQNISFTARRDLVPPVCALVGKYGDHIIPSGGDIRTPGAFVYAVPPDEYIEGASCGPTAGSAAGVGNATRNIHTGIKTPYAVLDGDTAYLGKEYEEGNKTTVASKFWSKFFPELKDLDGVQYGRYAVQTVDKQPEEFMVPEEGGGEKYELPDNYIASMSAQYALSTGSISGNNKHVRWNYSTITQYARIASKDVPADKYEMYRAWFPEDDVEGEGGSQTIYWRRLMTGRFVNINHRNGWERSDQQDSGEGLPDDEANKNDCDKYKDVLNNYHNSTRELPWEGSITLPRGLGDLDVGQLVGKRLNVTGSRPEWESMATPIQQVRVDLKSGAITISCGPADHLSFDELAERRDLANIRDKSPLTTTGDDPSIENGKKSKDFSASPLFANTSTANSAGGGQITPFALYRKNGRAILRGGLVRAGGTIIKVPDTDVGGAGEDYSKTTWYVALKRANGVYEAVVEKSVN